MPNVKKTPPVAPTYTLELTELEARTLECFLAWSGDSHDAAPLVKGKGQSIYNEYDKVDPKTGATFLYDLFVALRDARRT